MKNQTDQIQYNYIICVLHLYFNGCICTKIERELWETKEWYGPWILPFTILEKIGIPITSGLANNIFMCWGIAIVTWIIIRILFHNKHFYKKY